MLLRTPQRRRLRAGRGRRRVGLHGREHLPDEPFRRPAEQADAAVRPAHPDQLVGRVLVVRREHRAEAGDHRVERAVLVRQRLRVGLLPGDRQPIAGQDAARLEELGRQVAGDHLGTDLRGRDRRVATARCDVEHLVSAGDPAGLDEDGAEVADHVAGHAGVVAHRPHRAVLRLQLAVRGGARARSLCSWFPSQGLCLSACNPSSEDGRRRASHGSVAALVPFAHWSWRPGRASTGLHEGRGARCRVMASSVRSRRRWRSSTSDGRCSSYASCSPAAPGSTSCVAATRGCHRRCCPSG